jgi:ComF family protein
MSGRLVRRQLAAFVNYLLAPGLCLACGCELDNAESLCDCCGERLRRVPDPCCYCGQPNPVTGEICPACLHFGPTREYLQQLKYFEAVHLAKTLCRQCLDPFRQHWPRPEVLLPVPLHPERLLERGYNQADEIARIWSRELAIPVDLKTLTRIRATPSQSGLSAGQREDNVRQAFAYRAKHEYRHVAIVDDIVTTGSTVTEITKTLHRGGVEFVEVWALARVYRR